MDWHVFRLWEFYVVGLIDFQIRRSNVQFASGYPFRSKGLQRNMGKRKSKAGMTGLSRFVAVLHQDQASAQQIPTSSKSSVDMTAQDITQNETAPEEHLGDEEERPTKTVGAESKLARTAVQVITSRGSTARYDATGLVPSYNDISQVPEHLKKCTSVVLTLLYKIPFKLVINL